jgi:holin-like protein
MKKGLIFLLQLIFLLLISTLGYKISEFFHLPIPGNVIGMILLLLLLLSKAIKLEWVDLAGGFLTKHLAFFFIPIAVGLMNMGGLLAHYGFSLAVVILGSFVAGILLSSWTTQLLVKKGVKQHEHFRDNL